MLELKDGTLTAEQKQTEITNDIWDGESLLDESVFMDGYADKKIRSLGKIFDFDDTEILWDNSKFSIQADAFVLKAKIKG